MTIGGCSAVEICALLSSHFPDAVMREIEALIEQLVRVGESDAPLSVDAYKLLSAKYESPQLEQYSDMSELLLLDPIHEVDEQGWPKRAIPA